MDQQTIHLLRQYASQYEVKEFLEPDPSKFMHLVSGIHNQETMAFIASALSFGSRSQFLPKIESILKQSQTQPYEWICSGAYKEVIVPSQESYYRFYSNHTMFVFFQALEHLFHKYHSLGEFVSHSIASSAINETDTIRTLFALNDYFQGYGLKGIVPQPKTSLCKRTCMFLRWMVRTDSPVDLGIWSDIIDPSTLLIPIDTHVIKTAMRFRLVDNPSPTWKTVLELTKKMELVFPGDPAKGDFALYGADIETIPEKK